MLVTSIFPFSSWWFLNLLSKDKSKSALHVTGTISQMFPVTKFMYHKARISSDYRDLRKLQPFTRKQNVSLVQIENINRQYFKYHSKYQACLWTYDRKHYDREREMLVDSIFSISTMFSKRLIPQRHYFVIKIRGKWQYCNIFFQNSDLKNN